jgi:hypothetical protein
MFERIPPARRVLSVVIAVAALAFVGAQEDKPRRDPQALVGTWKVDLRPKPGADPYFKTFVVKTVDGNKFTGLFYDTEIEQGRINVEWGDVHFAFVTQDKSGAYNHSGVLRGDKIEGMTNSLGRDFLLVWRAEREK